jgi:RNA polymerase sigma factor (sigma-70 family)
MTEDWEELKRFVEERSDAAFETLVDRHFDLVWATAARITQNKALAKDIAQEVFTDLARRSPTLSQKVVLKGWLYRATFFAAKKASRREMRRSNHELEAKTWHAADTASDSHEMEQELIENLSVPAQALVVESAVFVTIVIS